MAVRGVNQPCKVIRMKQQTPKYCDESILLTVPNISVTGRSFHYCRVKEREGCAIAKLWGNPRTSLEFPQFGP
jgi:hypothetical protein